MKHQILASHLTKHELAEQAGDLLQIAELDPARIGEGRALRSELMTIGRDSIVIARLLLMIFNRKWDRVFHIVENRVFMRFAQADLIDPLLGVIHYLDRYNAWIAARLELAIRGVGEEESDESTRKAKVIESAKAIINTIRKEAGPNGDSLEAIFIAWVMRCARVRPLRLEIRTATGIERLQLEIPPKPQISAALGLGFEEEHPAHEHPQRRIKSSRNYWLISTTSGRRFAVPVESAPKGISIGASISYFKAHAVPAREWCLIDIDASADACPKDEGDGHEKSD